MKGGAGQASPGPSDVGNSPKSAQGWLERVLEKLARCRPPKDNVKTLINSGLTDDESLSAGLLQLFVSQFTPQDLAHVGLRQFVPEFDVLGALVAGELLGTVIPNFLLGQ